jgi:hypothetical protein
LLLRQWSVQAGRQEREGDWNTPQHLTSLRLGRGVCATIDETGQGGAALLEKLRGDLQRCHLVQGKRGPAVLKQHHTRRHGSTCRFA